MYSLEYTVCVSGHRLDVSDVIGITAQTVDGLTRRDGNYVKSNNNDEAPSATKDY